ncbi:hypothetical protein Ancab_010965 [Ancistrocladus abbreviatus]
MFRRFCFNGHILSQKPKNECQPSFDTMIKMLQSGYQSKTSANSIAPSCLDPLPGEVDGPYRFQDDTGHAEHTSAVGCGRKSEEIKSEYHVENDSGILQVGAFKRSKSLGCDLQKEGWISVENDAEDCTDQGFSCDGSHDCSATELSVPNFDLRTPEATPIHQDQEVLLSQPPPESSDLLKHESIFSIADPHCSEKEGHDSFNTALYVESGCHFGTHAPATPPMLAKSSSMPNFRSISPTYGGGSPCAFVASCNRSCVDLNALGLRNKEISGHDTSNERTIQLDGNDSLYVSDKYEGENAGYDGYASYGFAGSTKDWMMPVSDEIETEKNLLGESSSYQWEQFQGKEFKQKRIEEWVVDLQHYSPVEEINETPDAPVKVNRSITLLDNIFTARVQPRINPGMEAAAKCISSLNPIATSVQLANHGLVVIPFLSAFVGLKELNLSGNSIVKITAGALPRGLHMLNLSKNKISIIEGLRDLTRLRLLDLSCNKIVRIGHGLASCSCLKELYLAGNKISEVEGLHRLLKLSVLDLRFNKISTSKCLGQLAANYNSLQVISLEGNPAQKNVGDEQLKKYLQGLLPQLAYYNRQHIKSSKDSSERSVRLGMSSHQIERGLRSDHRSSRKGLKQSSYPTLNQKGQVVDSPKHSRGRHGHLPPSRTKGAQQQQQHQFDLGGRLVSSRSSSSLHKSRSMGSLAAI